MKGRIFRYIEAANEGDLKAAQVFANYVTDNYAHLNPRVEHINIGSGGYVLAIISTDIEEVKPS
jgi:hypothetical protein